MSSVTLSTNWPVARKEYRCHECSTPIAVGDRHRKQSGIFENEFYTMRAHTDCAEASHEIWLDAGLGYDEGVILSEEYANEPQEIGAFLLKDYPEVAMRLGISAGPKLEVVG